MPETPNHALPYPEGTDSALVPDDMQAAMEATDAALDSIAPSQIVGVPAGRLLIANGSGVVTGVQVSGDATVSPTGVLSIANGAVTRAKVPFIKTARKAVSVGANSVSAETVTFDTPFSESNVTVTASVAAGTNSDLLGLGILRVYLAAASVAIVLVVNSAGATRTGTVHVMAIQD